MGLQSPYPFIAPPKRAGGPRAAESHCFGGVITAIVRATPATGVGTAYG